MASPPTSWAPRQAASAVAVDGDDVDAEADELLDDELADLAGAEDDVTSHALAPWCEGYEAAVSWRSPLAARLARRAADCVEQACGGADGDGARRAEDGVMALGVDDHVGGDQPPGRPEDGCGRGPQDPVDPTHRDGDSLGAPPTNAPLIAPIATRLAVSVRKSTALATDQQADAQSRGGGDDPADPRAAIDPADQRLHGAEHRAAGQTAEHGGRSGVDVAGDQAGGHAGRGKPMKVASQRAQRLSRRCPWRAGPRVCGCPVRPMVGGGHAALLASPRGVRCRGPSGCGHDREGRWQRDPQAIGGDAGAIAWVVARAETTDAASSWRWPPCWPGPSRLDRAWAVAATPRDRQVVEIARARLDGDDDWSTRWPATTWSTIPTARRRLDRVRRGRPSRREDRRVIGD